MNTLKKIWISSLLVLMTLSQEALAARTVVLGAARGEDFRYVDARSLDPNNGRAQVELEKLEFHRGQFLLRGTWQNEPFFSITEADHPGGILNFKITLLDFNYPCGELRLEKATLMVAPRADGELEILEARLAVDRSADSCHLNVESFVLKLEEVKTL